MIPTSRATRGEEFIERTRLARIFHELLSRDRADGCATGKPQGVGPEAYLNSTSQGPTPEDARKEGHIRGRSRRFVKSGLIGPAWRSGAVQVTEIRA